MRLHVPPRMLLLALAATMLAALPACDGNKNDDDDDYEIPRYTAPLASKGGSASMNRMLATVRAATARFHDVAAAEAAGYVSTGECVALPGVGAMGIHYVNPPLMGDAGFDPARPEVLVYEPQADGSRRLVAAEFLVFRAPWDAAHAAAPAFGSQAFDQSFGAQAHGLPDHYELHLWLWRHNPAGMFASWNSKVSCAGAQV